MCVEITLVDEQTEVCSIADLFRVGFVVTRRDLPDDYDWRSDECLCNVDVEAILERSGLRHAPNPFGWDVFGILEE